MANEVMKSLFGMSSYEAEDALRRQQMDEDYKYAQLDPKAQLIFNARQAGRAIGGGINQMFGLVPEQLQRVRGREGALASVQQRIASGELDPNNQEELYAALSDALGKAGQAGDATLLSLHGATESLNRRKAEAQITKDLAAAEKSTKDKQHNLTQLMVAQREAVAAGDEEAANVYKAAIDKATHTTPEAVRAAGERALAIPAAERTPEQQAAVAAYNVWFRNEQTLRTAGSTKVNVGDGTKTTDVARIVGSADALKPYKTGHEGITAALTILDRAKAGNVSASVQLERYLSSMSGDKQLSIAEIQRIANAGSLSTRTANNVIGFLEGGKSDVTYAEWQELLEGMERHYREGYNDTQTRLKAAWTGAEGVSDARLNSIFGTPLTKVTKQQQQQQEAPKQVRTDDTSTGGTYKGAPVFKTAQGRFYYIGADGKQVFIKKKGTK